MHFVGEDQRRRAHDAIAGVESAGLSRLWKSAKPKERRRSHDFESPTPTQEARKDRETNSHYNTTPYTPHTSSPVSRAQELPDTSLPFCTA
jgi:hypothetical protein